MPAIFATDEWRRYRGACPKGGPSTGRLKITQCPQGHPYDETNTFLYQGRRYCRACRKIRDSKDWEACRKATGAEEGSPRCYHPKRVSLREERTAREPCVEQVVLRSRVADISADRPI